MSGKTPDSLNILTKAQFKDRSDLFVKDNKFPTSQGAKSRRMVSSPQAVFGYNGDYIMSTDTDYLTFSADFAFTASRMFQPQVDEQGFGSSPIISNFGSVMSVPGIFATPYSIPHPQTHSRSDETTGVKDDKEGPGIQQVPTPGELRLFEALMDMFFENVEPDTFKIAKLSSTTLPAFRTDRTYKLGLFNSLSTNMARILSSIKKGRINDLMNAHVILGYVLIRRAQPDSGKFNDDFSTFDHKRRQSSNSEFLRDPSAPPSLVDVDFSGPLEQWTSFKKAWAMRSRTVYALSGGVNMIINMFANPFRYAFLKSYAFTFKTTTALNLYSKIKDAVEVVGVDVTQMDQGVQKWFTDLFSKRFGEATHESVGILHDWAMHAPFFTSQDDVRSENYFVGDPAVMEDFRNEMGLPSGIGTVSDLGKLWMIPIGFIAVNKALNLIDLETATTAEIIAILKVYLSGKHPLIGTLNAGDDAIFMLKGSNAHVNARKLRMVLNDESALADMKMEEGIAFLGYVIYKVNGVIQIPSPNPVTAFSNRLANETQWHDKRKIYSGFGYLRARENAEKIGPLYRELEGLQDEKWQEHMSVPVPKVLAAMDEKVNYPPISKVSGFDLTAVDREVLNDVSKMFYKFSTEDISQDVLSYISYNVPAETWFPRVAGFFNTKIGVTI